jgi:MoaA/NifB/PqqE/SkfB family radical SAM enzyme
LDFFTDNFTNEVLDNVHRISFCGDDGDPIYATDFLDIIAYLKLVKPELSIQIVTNGSYKKPDWWAKLGRTLNHHDEIHWSIDGYSHESNEIYRVNSNFESILTGIKSCNTTALKTWAAIYFKFNESKIDQIVNIAASSGLDRVQLTKSTKFGYFYPNLQNSLNQQLEPTDKNLISTTGRFERNIIHLTPRSTSFNVNNTHAILKYHDVLKSRSGENIIPLCLIGTKGLYINSQGYFVPCCWVANRYEPNYQDFLKSEFNIKERGIEAVINSPLWAEFFNSMSTNKQCNEKCHRRNISERYITDW